MGTTQRRWPKNAEAARVESREAAEVAIALLIDARTDIDTLRNLTLAKLKMTEAIWLMERIWRLMAEAKHGTPGSTEQETT